MKLNEQAIYRRNIGIYHNNTHKYFGDGQLTERLNQLALYPGNAAARCRANLMLHVLLLVANAADTQAYARHGRQGGHAATGDGPAHSYLRQIRAEQNELPLPLAQWSEITGSICNGKISPAPISSLSAAANVDHKAWVEKAISHQTRRARSADGINHHDRIGRLRAGTDTTAPAANHSLVIEPHGALYYPQENGKVAVDRQNAAMSVFLRDYIINDSAIINPITYLVRGVVSYIALDEKNIHKLAKVLLESVAYYGGGKGESIPDNVAGMVVRRWLHINVLKKTFENFFTELLSIYQDLESVSLLSLGTRLNNVLADFSANISTWDGAADEALFTERLWARAIIPELPVLEYWQETPFNKISMMDFKLGEMQAGLIFARQSGIDINTLTREEAAELGEFIQLQVEAGIAPPQWLMFYQFPALVRFMASQKGDYQETVFYTSAVHDALQYYFKEKERYLEANNPFNELAGAMANYKSRTKLAGEIIDTFCPQVSVSEYLIKITPTCLSSAAQSANKYIPISKFGRDAGAPSATMLFFHPDQVSEVELPDIDNVFIVQNKAITEKFSVVERLLLNSAWSAYFDTNNSYWRGVTVDKYVASIPSVNPKFGFKYCQTRWFRESPNSYVFSAENAKIVMDPDTELFTVNRFNQDVLYALSRNKEGYRIIYISPLENDSSFKLTSAKVSVCLLKTRNLLSSSQDFEQLIDSLVADHAAQLMSKLYDAGYDKHFVHVAKDFFLSLVPFYSCIDGITEDAAEETIFDCAVDIVSLVPVLGQINHLMAKSSTLLFKGLHTAGRSALTMAASRYTLKEIAARSAKLLFFHSLQPASKLVSLNEMIAFAKGAARFIDPGFEIIYFVGKKSFRQVTSVSKHMGKNLPTLKALFERTPYTPSLLQQPARFNAMSFAIEKGTGRRIGVQLLDDQKYRGREVYAMSNLETGILFGPKLFLTKKNHFRAIPVKFSTKVKIIRHQGLGGKGGPRAAKKWGDDSPSAAGHSSASGSSNAAASVVRPESSSFSHVIHPFKAKQWEFNEHGLFADNNVIRAKINDKSASVIYDLSRNVFYLRQDKSKVNTIIEHIPQESYSLNPAGKLEKSNTLALASATFQEQYDGIKALGIDLAWNSSPIKILADFKKPIPRKITSIWVGKNDIPVEIIKNLQNNAAKAKEFPRPYDFKLYLSSDNSDVYFRNMARLNELAKDVVVINLEFTDYYHVFSQTKNYEHYLAAIEGNRGRATNFASACDVLRLDLLNRRGGLYLDADDTLFLPPGLFELKTNPNGLILSTPVYHSALNLKGKYPNSIWGTHANNPTLDSMLEESYQRYMSHKELYMQRPPIEDEVAFAQFSSTLSYVTGPDLFNHVIDQYLPNEKQTREALKLFNLPIVMDRPTYAKLEEYWDLEVCALKNIAQVGNAHTWRHSR
ncbi:glycosyltransferase [Sodalis sp. dw_96]|uniref:glycosyltransferase n=1 Tax=Sodalis sp. dw_96 TaxID=2719794 RepID=UPI001BD5FC8B|nr:glycosyltransferase [Sodalis sp. dw_96]